jgi:hypothetical protein
MAGASDGNALLAARARVKAAVERRYGATQLANGGDA